MNAPKNLKKYLDGKLPFPAGFVPLAEESSRLICVDAFSMWRTFCPKKKSQSLAFPMWQWQRDAMESIVATLGGTSAKAAAAIGVSPRTVESWRCGRKRLTVERAYEIARAMANQ